MSEQKQSDGREPGRVDGDGVARALGAYMMRREHVFAEDTIRGARNAWQSLRLFSLVALVAALMGVAAWAFLMCLDAVTGFREAHLICFALLPAVGVFTAWLYRRYGKDAARGNNLVIDCAVSGRRIPPVMAPFTFVCSVATHLAGGSAGREGTAVQIGGTIADAVSRLFKLGEYDHQDLLMAGISAAFGGVFGTPLAGAFFGMEMCYIGKLHYAAGIYCLVASFVGDLVATMLGAPREAYPIGLIPEFDARGTAYAVIAGIACGVAARLFSAAIRAVRHFYSSRITNYLAAALIGSLVLLGVYVAFGLFRYAGLSSWLIEAGFAGEVTPVDALIKLVVTAFTLGAGFQGGEVTPLFGIGAALGGWLGLVLGVQPSFMAALGLIGIFGAALNVPITTIMLGVDLFGGYAAPFYVIVSFVGYIVAGHRGVYPAQRIVTPKWRSLDVDQGDTVEAAIERHASETERAEDPGRMAHAEHVADASEPSADEVNDASRSK
ncbi:chloride channel protein [Enorma phocaeensis]|uniref:chloride channel protein n=1 Tax=Enorma phocaeensis TaxID=1871019 RepID=UPI0032082511